MKFIPNPYEIAVQWRNNRFDSGKNHIDSANSPVISIGNISAGGTGKTPFVRMLSAFLRSNGNIPAVVSRGYGRRTRGVIIAGNGMRSGMMASPDEVGDELALHAADGIAIAAEKRIDGCRKAIGLGATLCILDDGFQHRQLYRNLDVVLLDRKTLYGRIMPFGRLREPLANIRRAHIIALRDDITQDNIRYIPTNPNSLVIRYTSKIGTAYMLGKANEPASTLHSDILAVCGIAQPERFFAAIENSFPIIGKITLPDHARYNSRIISKILESTNKLRARTIITTEKDAVKLLQFKSIFDDANITVMVLPVQTIISEAADEFYNTISAIVKNWKH